METGIVESFMYVESSKQLWSELIERFGQTNGILLYQLKRNLSSMEQGNLSVSEYYCNLKRLWDEIQCLESFPDCQYGALSRCACEIVKKIQEQESRNRLIQFLMGLSQDFDSIRSMILSVDDLPSVNKAFYLVQQFERQKLITSGSLGTSSDGSAYNANRQSNGKDKKTKDNRKCDFCHMKGHVKDKCYKLHGYPPNWRFKKANAAETEEDNTLDVDNGSSSVNSALITAMCKEVAKMFKNGALSSANAAGSSSANVAERFRKEDSDDEDDSEMQILQV